MKVRLKMNITVLDKLTEGLNEQQKQAVEMPINSFTKVVAGAGTGKTKIISKDIAIEEKAIVVRRGKKKYYIGKFM